MIRTLLLFLLLLGLHFKGYSQQFGAFPSRTKWRQLDTDTARILYTTKSEKEAQRVATIVHQLARQENALGSALKKVNIVLHNQTTLANGYVGLAPFRSEFYLVPGGNIFDFGNLPWQEQLAVHEYRHVQQYNNFNRGISKGFGILFGQEGRSLANALAIPDWFFEGDAVYAETVLTPQGRGKTPYFHNEFKSLWREGRDYNWMKLRNGSFKDFVPNHYPLGYLLVNYGYLKYGTDFWKKVTQDAVAFRGLLYPFQQAVKRQAGIPFSTFRKDALQYYSHEVSKRRNDKRNRETVVNFYFPQFAGADSIIYLKDSYKHIPTFYVKTGTKESRIKQKSIGSEEWFSYRNGMVVYTAYNTDPRWSLLNFNDIVLLDIKTGKENWLTQKGRYFTPDISPDGQFISALSVTDSITSELHIINLKGETLSRIKAPDRAFFVQPKFIDNDRVVLGIRWPDATLSMEVVNLSTQQLEALIPRTNATLGFPYVQNNTIYFTSSLSGNDNIYAIQLKDKKVHQLTNSQTGLYFPNVSKDTLTYSAFTSNGYKIEQTAVAKNSLQEISSAQWKETIIPFTVAGNTNKNILNVATRPFESRPYNKATGFFNFHSWRPDYADPEFSFSVYSDNILNTFTNEIYYRYNTNENSHALGFNAIYGGWFPMIQAGVERVNSRHINSSNRNFILNQTEANLGFFIPLNFTKGKTLKSFRLGSQFNIASLEPASKSPEAFTKFQSTFLNHSISWAQQLPRARQHIYPRFGYGLSANYRHRLSEKGFQTLGNSTIYLPGVLPNHSIVLQGSYQETDTANVIFSNRFSNSRGYADYYFSKMLKGGINYHFPIIYPDRGFGNIVYLLRMRGNAFYDYTRVYSNNKQNSFNLRSVGSELFFDTKWWNTLPLTLGIRYNYLLDAELVGASNRNRFEFIIPINIIPD